MLGDFDLWRQSYNRNESQKDEIPKQYTLLQSRL